jgi:hypothetical protein
MSTTRTQRAIKPAENTLFLCINGGETFMQHAWLCGLEHACDGLVIALSGNIQRSRIDALKHLVIRWKEGRKVVAHTAASILEIVPATTPRGRSLLGETQRRPWPTLRQEATGSVLRISNMEIHRDPRPWDTVPSPQRWRYLDLPDARVMSSAFRETSARP